MIVVDTNVIAYLYLPTDHTPLAERLLTHHPDWAAPILWRSELRNVLALHLRKGLITLQQAYEIQSEAEALLAGAEYELPSLPVLELAKQSGCSAYDCEFVALAQQLGTRLITVDEKLIAQFPEMAMAFERASQLRRGSSGPALTSCHQQQRCECKSKDLALFFPRTSDKNVSRRLFLSIIL